MHAGGGVFDWVRVGVHARGWRQCACACGRRWARAKARPFMPAEAFEAYALKRGVDLRQAA